MDVKTVEACLAISKAIHAEAARVAHPDAEGWTQECVDRIAALSDAAVAKGDGERKPYGDLRNAKFLDPECYGAGACQSLKFKAQTEAVQAENAKLRTALSVVRAYPDFDDGGPLPEMMDQVLRGERAPMLEKLAELTQASAPESFTTSSPQGPTPAG